MLASTTRMNNIQDVLDHLDHEIEIARRKHSLHLELIDLFEDIKEEREWETSETFNSNPEPEGQNASQDERTTITEEGPELGTSEAVIACDSCLSIVFIIVERILEKLRRRH